MQLGRAFIVAVVALAPSGRVPGGKRLRGAPALLSRPFPAVTGVRIPSGKRKGIKSSPRVASSSRSSYAASKNEKVSVGPRVTRTGGAGVPKRQPYPRS